MGPTKWWSTLNTRRERTSEVLRGPCKVCHVRIGAAPDAALLPRLPLGGPIDTSAQNLWIFLFYFPYKEGMLIVGTKKKLELEAARRSSRGGAAMTSAVQEPATATIDEAVASISFSAVALPSTMMPTFFPAAVNGAVL